jgi:hypothetical protein
MANIGAARFYKRLVGLKCNRWKPSEDTEREYVDRLSKWRLSQDEWAAALDLIAEDLMLGEGLPQLTEIYAYLKRSQVKRGPERGITWQTFDYGGIRYARKVSDPAHPPELPAGASNARLHIPEQQQYRAELVGEDELVPVPF